MKGLGNSLLVESGGLEDKKGWFGEVLQRFVCLIEKGFSFLSQSSKL